MDFTLPTYKKLLQELLTSGYSFQTLQDFIQKPEDKTVILRHDVDRLPENTLKMARMENGENVKASYYFRIVKESFDKDIIKKIAEIGNEVGYHYEDLSLYGGNYELSIINFELDLKKLRKLYPVKTICMHGSPLSKWDNRDLWKRYNYKDYSIIAEPYFDVDFDAVFYITDTGRRWDGDSVSVRDKVSSQLSKRLSPGMNRMIPAGLDGKNKRDEWMDPFGGMNRMAGSKKKEFKDLSFHSTWDIIKAADRGLLPDKIIINVHPQRWTDRFGPWLSELIKQNVKNVIKKWMIAWRQG